MQRPKATRCLARVVIRDELHETIRQIVDGRVEDDTSMIDEQDVSQQIFDFFDLMRCHQNRTFVIKIIVEQRLIEGPAVQQIETECRLIEDQ